jgi:topoisomerase-4 subunit B
VRKLRLPASWPTARRWRLQVPNSSSSRATRPAARPSRRATARRRPILPLRGKILNVASAGRDKLARTSRIRATSQALGCGTRSKYREEDLRYERVIIMTDADVDGAHIASLLITFFYQEMPGAHPMVGTSIWPCRRSTRIRQGGKVAYARDDAHKDELLKTEFKGRGKIEIGRFKGLGEMMPAAQGNHDGPEETHAAACRGQ